MSEKLDVLGLEFSPEDTYVDKCRVGYSHRMEVSQSTFDQLIEDALEATGSDYSPSESIVITITITPKQLS